MSKRFFFSLAILFLLVANTVIGQVTPQKKALSLRVSDLINLELNVDYHIPIRSKVDLTVSTGVKYYSDIKSNFNNNQPIINYYTAKVNQRLVNLVSLKHTEVLDNPIYSKDVTAFYHNTKSLNIYGKIIPKITIPIQLSFRQYLNKKNTKGKLFINSGINLYAHIGQRVKISTTFLNAVDPVTAFPTGFSSIYGEVTAKFKEEILAQPGMGFSSTISSGIGWQYAHKEKFFIEVNPIIEFNLKYTNSSIDYHGLRQIQPRILVALGRYF